MKKILLILLLTVAPMRAQHCGYDYSGLMVLYIHAEGETAVVPNLKVTLLDTLGKTLMTQIWRDGNTAQRRFEADTLKFWRNPDRTTFPRKENTVGDSNVRFPFAKDNYVLVCGTAFRIGELIIKIEDTNGTANQGFFETVMVATKSAKVYPLCGRYDLESYPEEYRPLEIILKKR